jgi:hypothetical protein
VTLVGVAERMLTSLDLRRIYRRKLRQLAGVASERHV